MIETHEKIDMQPIYHLYPVLADVESKIDPRFERRRPILNYIPRYKRGWKRRRENPSLKRPDGPVAPE